VKTVSGERYEIVHRSLLAGLLNGQAGTEDYLLESAIEAPAVKIVHDRTGINRNVAADFDFGSRYGSPAFQTILLDMHIGVAACIHGFDNRTRHGDRLCAGPCRSASRRTFLSSREGLNLKDSESEEDANTQESYNM